MKIKAELFKVVKSPDGNIICDKTGKSAGRGAYVCRDGQCISALIKTRAIERAFKCSIPKDKIENIMKEMI